MNMPRRLSNHFSDCRLVSLAKLRTASEIPNRDSKGPYVIMQYGYEPDDLSMRGGDYLLGRSGAWLGTHWFVRMPVPERRKEFVFGSKVEVIELLETLTGRVRVISEKPASVDEDAEADAEWQQALKED